VNRRTPVSPDLEVSSDSLLHLKLMPLMPNSMQMIDLEATRYSYVHASPVSTKLKWTSLDGSGTMEHFRITNTRASIPTCQKQLV
jgi:hypothetical protein